MVFVYKQTVGNRILINSAKTVLRLCKNVVGVVAVDFGYFTDHKIAHSGFCKETVENIGG